MERDTRQLAAIMLTDIVGYTALTQVDEALTLALLEEHASLLRPLFAEHSGREIKGTGDGFLVEFPSALEAVRCAIEIQRALHERNSAVPLDRTIQVRIGVHLGDVVHRGSDIFGDGVNITARIEPLAEPGGICLSRQVYDAVWNKIDLRMTSLGKRALKNVRVPIEVYGMELPWMRDKMSSSLSRDRSRLVVLPLVSISQNAGDAYFADGLTEELIFALSKVKELQVIAATSAMKYRGASKSISEIGAELGVGTALEGSVRKAGNRLRITLQLVDVEDEAHLWSEVYERALDDVFAVQTEIAGSVAAALEVHLSPRPRRPSEDRAPASPEASEVYLKGRAFFSRRSPDSTRAAIECFERAIELDPSRAEFYAALSMAYSVLFNYAPQHDRGWHAKATANALKALSLDPDLPEAHAAWAPLLADELDFVGAEQEYRRAIELSPSYATAHHWLGLLLSLIGRHEEAAAALKASLELDPLSASQHGGLGQVYLRGGQTDRALEALDMASALGEDNLVLRLFRGQAYLFQERFDLARVHLEKARELAGGFEPETEYWLAYLEETAGTRGVMERVLQQALDHAGHDHVPAYALAPFYFALEQDDEGFECLERSYRAHEPELLDVATDPRFAPCRGNLRFAAFLKRIGFPEAAGTSPVS
ncbi:MAG: adenylate/guanylate cyclase domain-containing protein [Candidatus Bipolaricaulis sp.]|nr:adenylate/guanylate cyclase domain-containing protein [Candidatus Bipolaricaulis sp.]